MRGTWNDGDPNTDLQIITAYLTESGVVLGQEKIHEKTNEIPVFQKMLDDLNVKGKTVTADATHCQKETCRKIVEREGDYLRSKFLLYCNEPSAIMMLIYMKHSNTYESSGGTMDAVIIAVIAAIITVIAPWALQ